MSSALEEQVKDGKMRGKETKDLFLVTEQRVNTFRFLHASDCVFRCAHPSV